MFELKNIVITCLLFTVCHSWGLLRNNQKNNLRNPFKDTTETAFQNECNTIANKYRSKHHAKPLKIDQKTIEYSKKRCQLISREEKLKHGTGDVEDDFGENQFWRLGVGASPCSKAMEFWYSTSKAYDWKKPETSEGADYFSQLVWKSTTGMGCARCNGGGGKRRSETYVVCDFTPGGNIEGIFVDNVSRP